MTATPDRSRYEIVPIGSLHTGFALKVDGVIRRSSPDMLSLAAYVDAVRAGVDTDELSSRTMEANKVPGLFVIGEAVDVTGWLGGYNFQWAWSSGWAAGEAV